MPELYQSGFYNTGTASIAQGQTVVTGQGTAWLQAVRSADDFGKHVGRPIPIASVDSDTQITLAYPWPGPTQAAAPYRISFTPYHVAYRQALQQIGKLLASGNVSALAGLEGAAGKVPLFTGPGVLDLMNILPVQESKDDVQNGTNSDFAKLLRVDSAINAKNAFFGKYFGGSANKNIDTLLPGETGLFSNGNPGSFPPSSGTFWFIETQRHLYNNCRHQFLYRYAGTGGAIPEIWFRVANDANVFSQLVPVVPSRGSNANGEYVRFADGTQICWLNDFTMIVNEPSNMNELRYTWTYPAAFVNGNVFVSFNRPRTSGSYSGVLFTDTVSPIPNPSSLTTTVSFFKTVGSAWNSGAQIANCRAIAFGRWY
ncbi:hypothetical protein [Nitratireductor indicus]|uniref:hypothetical protein n=1 Tax=Nitratireductor indicus TaxID=721133 RepID=UPI0028760E2B|nr:hypothetical protein [Nitratireductor indicus]MDS1135557.1 hypothetical protein [Nitratireductor indicus]